MRTAFLMALLMGLFLFNIEQGEAEGIDDALETREVPANDLCLQTKDIIERIKTNPLSLRGELTEAPKDEPDNPSPGVYKATRQFNGKEGKFIDDPIHYVVMYHLGGNTRDQVFKANREWLAAFKECLGKDDWHEYGNVTMAENHKRWILAQTVDKPKKKALETFEEPFIVIEYFPTSKYSSTYHMTNTFAGPKN